VRVGLERRLSFIGQSFLSAYRAAIDLDTKVGPAITVLSILGIAVSVRFEPKLAVGIALALAIVLLWEGAYRAWRSAADAAARRPFPKVFMSAKAVRNLPPNHDPHEVTTELPLRVTNREPSARLSLSFFLTRRRLGWPEEPEVSSPYFEGNYPEGAISVGVDPQVTVTVPLRFPFPLIPYRSAEEATAGDSFLLRVEDAVSGQSVEFAAPGEFEN
jgi:hypothetical protein